MTTKKWPRHKNKENSIEIVVCDIIETFSSLVIIKCLILNSYSSFGFALFLLFLFVV